MAYKFCPALLLICLFFSSKAQPIINTISSDKTNVLNGLFYADTTCSLNFEDVSTARFSKYFQKGNLAETIVADNINCYWVEIDLQNIAGNNNDWLIEFDKWISVEMYIADSAGGLAKKVTGHVVPFAKKSFPLANRNLIDIIIKNSQLRKIYVKLTTGYQYMQRPANLSCTVYSKAVVLQHHDLIKNIVIFFSGIYLVMLLYNLLVFFSIREKSYLYYLGVILIALIALWENTGYTVELFRSIEQFPSWLTNFDLVASSLFGIVMVLFTKTFLRTKEHSPITNKILSLIIVALLVVLLPALFGHSFLATNISRFIGMVTTLLILIASVRSYRQRFPSSGIFLLANGVFMISILVFLTLEIFKMDQTFLYDFSISIGSVFQIVLFSFALGDRINVLKKQNEESQLKIIEQLKLYGEFQDKINKQLEEKVEERTKALKDSQQRLVQQEKLASLGEVTAGVAHEIQNPLNFVNNFSEVSNEMIDEMKSELDKGGVSEAKAIADDIKLNLEKILHHGKRADAIVKGMLQHSRTNSGQKELFDMNALCDEYLRLAYHGLLAKDKSFKAKCETDFDNSIEKINLVPQDIGRVVLNLINNAFYAVGEKANEDIVGYEPTVIVSTQKLTDKVEVNVKDNGNGIPQNLVDKIFQPFFTTKPTGQGTGLGLSLAYDIIKAHGGEIRVETRVGEGSEFIIQLPQT